MIFKIVNNRQKDEIMRLYKSLIGQKGCTWDKEYPNEKIIESDINNKGIYCLKKGEQIIAVASLIKDVKLNKILDIDDDNVYLLTRVGVNKKYQGKGYAKILIRKIIKKTVGKNVKKIYLLVNTENIRAKKLYTNMKFVFLKEVNLYGIKWEVLMKNNKIRGIRCLKN